MFTTFALRLGFPYRRRIRGVAFGLLVSIAVLDAVPGAFLGVAKAQTARGPVQNPDWTKFVQGLRDAGMAAYKAAQSKNQDNILEAAGTMTEACANCHDKYREKPNLADRCK